jgi:hypothetical protein
MKKDRSAPTHGRENGQAENYVPPLLIETVRLKSIVQQFPSEPPPPGREPYEPM